MPLHGLRAEYYIKAMGMKVAHLVIEHDAPKQQIQVKAVSLMSNKIFPRINNTYVVSYLGNFLPRSYLREIDQNNVCDSVLTTYDHRSKEAVIIRHNPSSAKAFEISSHTRDYFSFMMLLTTQNLKDGVYRIDGNGLLYNAKLVYEKSEVIKTEKGKFNTRKYNISFIPLKKEKMPYIDMVTHNTLHKDTRISIWIGDNGVALKASVRKSALGMSWELIDFCL